MNGNNSLLLVTIKDVFTAFTIDFYNAVVGGGCPDFGKGLPQKKKDKKKNDLLIL